MKNFILTLIGLLILIIESSITNYIGLFSITINILLVYLVVISLYKQELEAALIGAIVGIVRDITVGGIFGLNALIMFSIGYLISFLRVKIYRESYITVFVLVFMSSAIDSIVNILFVNQLYAKYDMIHTLIKGIIYMPFVNGIFSIIFYFAFKKWISKLKRE